jgi:hypothetical protein
MDFAKVLTLVLPDVESMVKISVRRPTIDQIWTITRLFERINFLASLALQTSRNFDHK